MSHGPGCFAGRPSAAENLGAALNLVAARQRNEPWAEPVAEEWQRARRYLDRSSFR